MSDFGDAFYFTGGGFSDWSGRSAGKFDNDAFGSSSDSCVGGVYVSPRVKQRLAEEKAHGLPQNATELPSFIGKWRLAWRIVLLLLLLSVSLIGPYVYIQQDDGEAYFVAGFWTLLATGGWVAFMSWMKNWYPEPRAITLVRLIHFTRIVDALVILSAIFMLLVITTPLWGPYSDEFWFEHQDLLIRDLHHPVHHYIYWYHWVFVPMFTFIPIVYLLIRIVEISRKKRFDNIYRYLQYKDDTLAKEQKVRLEEIAKLRNQITEEQRVLLKLYTKLKDLELQSKEYLNK